MVVEAAPRRRSPEGKGGRVEGVNEAAVDREGGEAVEAAPLWRKQRKPLGGAEDSGSQQDGENSSLTEDAELK